MKLPNNYGSIEKLSGKRRKPYMVRKTVGWDDNGKQIRKIVGYFETRTQALQELALFNENPYDIDAKKITLNELHEKWKNEKFPKIAPKTQVVYRMCWNYCKDIEEEAFVDIKINQLQSIVDSMGDKWSAKKAFKVFFNQLYDYAIKNDLNIKKYSSYLDIGKKTTKLERIPFEEEEINKLWENVSRMDFIDTILILIYTGMRVGELLDIKIENVFIDKKYMRGGSKTDAGKNRIIPIHDRILPLVKKWYDNAIKIGSEYLIYNHEGKQMLYWNYYHEKWEKIIEQIEFNPNHKPHDTRHTFATRMDRTDANKLCIKRILGHASKDITDKVYTHKDIEELIEAVNLLR
ncbi:MAG: tyrosine-type recombinase/integrase [Bacilli bacterium]|nr:tyrosine-type recombinase/integrase [Bacilli bacterium]